MSLLSQYHIPFGGLVLLLRRDGCADVECADVICSARLLDLGDDRLEERLNAKVSNFRCGIYQTISLSMLKIVSFIRIQRINDVIGNIYSLVKI